MSEEVEQKQDFLSVILMSNNASLCNPKSLIALDIFLR